MATGTRSKFCTRKCMDAKRWRDKHKKEVICKYCQQVSKMAYSRSFCSEECKNLWYSLKEPTGKWYYLKTKYNITIQQYNCILESQGGVCAICKEDSTTTWHIDHDHNCCKEKAKSCGKCIRGILCNSCNNGLGRFKDSTEILQAAIEYLNQN